MDQWAEAIKKNLPKLIEQLDSAAFNGLLDHLYSVGLLNQSDTRRFLKSDTDSYERRESKIREFLLHVSGNLTKDRLRVFYDSLLKVELTDAAQLIKPFLPNPQERQQSTPRSAKPEEHQVKPQTKPQTAKLGAISSHPTTVSTESHSNGDTRQSADDQLSLQPNTGTVHQVACLQSPSNYSESISVKRSMEYLELECPGSHAILSRMHVYTNTYEL